VLRLLTTAVGPIDYLVTGAGEPVTVFAHGLAQSIAETRPLGSGVSGSRVFLHFMGHGRSGGPTAKGWTYVGLAEQLRAVAEATGATRALGVSLGAGALTRLVADEPERFARLVFFLPAVIDRPRAVAAQRRLRELAACLEADDVDGAAELLLAEQPAAVRRLQAAQVWVRRQARALAGTAVIEALRTLPGAVPLADRAALAAVRAPALVVAQPGDDAHPVAVAEELAAALPDARLHVFPAAGAIWLQRQQVRQLVAGFLNED